jgi:hypothetical protein
MVELATDEAMILNMNQKLRAICEPEQQIENPQQKYNLLDVSQEDSYYDIRIKAHRGFKQRLVIFIFNDVSAEKEL